MQLYLDLRNVYYMPIHLEKVVQKGKTYKLIKITTALFDEICEHYHAVYVVDRDTGFKMYSDLLSFIEKSKLIKKELSKESEDFYFIPFVASDEDELDKVEVSKFQLKLMMRFHYTWYNRLYDYLVSSDFKSMIELINADRKRYDVFPDVDRQFRAFLETSYSAVKVVFLGYDPYPAYYANGLCFAYEGKATFTPKSLQVLEWGINQNKVEKHPNRNKNLVYLSHQGVLMLNSSLTAINSEGIIHKHWEIWKQFTKFAIRQFDLYKQPIIFVLFGEQANFYKRYINKRHTVITVEHPAMAARENRPWQHEKLFEEVNKFLKSKGRDEILW